MQSVDEHNCGTLIVTGGGRGIGAAVARLGAARGYRVVVNYQMNETAALGVVDSILSNGGQAIAVRADIALEGEVMQLFDAAHAEFGPLTALINCAAIPGTRSRLMDMDADEMSRILNVNLSGMMFCAREAMRRMAKSRGGQGGGIVLLSSQAAETGGNLLATYAVSKGAINVLTKALAREVTGEGLRVNAISPGVISTDQQPLDDEQWIERAVSSIPVGRLGTPEDVAVAALWLLSSEAAYINGSVLGVTGGR